MPRAATVGELWRPLLRSAELAHAGAQAPLDSLLERLLGDAIGQPPPPAARSGLNSDGMPLQWCTSLRPGGADVVLIGDPHSDIADTRARLARSVDDARALPRLLGCEALGPLVEKTLSHILPDAAEDPRVLPRGGLWLAASLGRPAVALYACAAWGSDLVDRWARIDRWLDDALPDCREARAVVQSLRLAASPECACIEGSDPASARVKVYFRLLSSEVPGAVRQRVLADRRIAQFLRRVLGDQGVPSSALTFCISFLVRSGACCDSKVDVCGHCVRRTAPQWQQLLEDVGPAFDVDTRAARQLLSVAGFGLSLIGAGTKVDGEPRLNVYGRMGAPAAGALARATLPAPVALAP